MSTTKAGAPDWPETFAKRTAKQYGRHVHGLTLKRAGEIFDSLPTARTASATIGYENAHTSRASSSGIGHVGVSYKLVRRADFDAAIMNVEEWRDARGASPPLRDIKPEEAIRRLRNGGAQ